MRRVSEMNLGVKIQLLSFCFRVFNFIFLVLGLSVFGLGFWIVFGRENLLTVLPSDGLRTVGVGLLIISVVVLAVTVVGCVTAKNKVLLLLYVSFLIVLVLGQLFITLLLLINRDQVERSLDHTVDDIILQYKKSSSKDALMDKIQNYEGCCGRTGPADWLKNSFIQSLNLTNPDVLPCSCFRSYRHSGNSPWCSELLNFTAPLYGQGNSSYSQGCQKKLSDWLQENILTVVGMNFSLMFIQVVQFVLIVYLYHARAALKKPDHLDDDDLDHGEQNYAYIEPEYDYIDPTHPAHLNGNTGPDDGYIDPALAAHLQDNTDSTHLPYHRDNPNYSSAVRVPEVAQGHQQASS